MLVVTYNLLQVNYSLLCFTSIMWCLTFFLLFYFLISFYNNLFSFFFYILSLLVNFFLNAINSLLWKNHLCPSDLRQVESGKRWIHGFVIHTIEIRKWNKYFVAQWKMKGKMHERWKIMQDIHHSLQMFWSVWQTDERKVSFYIHLFSFIFHN